MDQVLVFLSDNWKWLLEIVLAIASILIVILRKKVKVYESVKEYILSMLPYYINFAESLYDSGFDKKTFVYDAIVAFLKGKFGNFDESKYVDFIKDSIESILSTPQKKGV